MSVTLHQHISEFVSAQSFFFTWISLLQSKAKADCFTFYFLLQFKNECGWIAGNACISDTIYCDWTERIMVYIYAKERTLPSYMYKDRPLVSTLNLEQYHPLHVWELTSPTFLKNRMPIDIPVSEKSACDRQRVNQFS